MLVSFRARYNVCWTHSTFRRSATDRRNVNAGAVVERISEGDGGMTSTSERIPRSRPRKLVTSLYAALLLVVIYFASFGPLLYVLNRSDIRLDDESRNAVNAYNLPRTFLCERIPIFGQLCFKYDDFWASLGVKHRGD